MRKLKKMIKLVKNIKGFPNWPTDIKNIEIYSETLLLSKKSK